MDGFCKWNNDMPLGCRPKLIEYSGSCEDLAAALKPTLKERLHRADFNVEQLEIRFNLEDEYLANGLSIRKKCIQPPIYRAEVCQSKTYRGEHYSI